jgi:PKD repeat protein
MKKITPITIIISIFLGITLLSINTSCQETRTIKIVDAQTGTNSTILGNTTSSVPPRGYPFTVNVTLEGTTDKLFVYQVAIKFDRTKIRCTAAWINRNDPNFVFYNYRSITVIPNAEINNDEGYVFLGASLIGEYYVNVSSGLLCQINFTAIKTGSYSLQILPSGGSPETFLAYAYQENLIDIPFNTESFSITLIAAPTPPIASFTFNPANPKANQSVTFNAEESYDPDGEITYYLWDFGDSVNVTTNETTEIHTFPSNGIYLVKLTVYDNNNSSDSISKEVQVGQIPIVKFNYEPALIMPNQLITFDASDSYDPDGNIISYVWNFGDGNITSINDKVVTHAFPRKGVFWVNLTIYDYEKLHNSTLKEIFVGKSPTVEFTYSIKIVDEKYVVNFDALQSYAGEAEDYIVSYVWDFGDYNTTETTSPTIEHIYLEQGDYPVKLTVYDNNGLYNSTIKIIKVQKSSEIDTTILIAAGIIIFATLGVIAIFKNRKRFSRFKK